MIIWSNPEFVRHIRAQLRLGRFVAASSIAVIVAVLTALLSWSAQTSGLDRVYGVFYATLAGIQFFVIGIGCAYYCGQAISQERVLRTFDFLRTTRMSSAELIAGMMFGAPVITYVFGGVLTLFTIPAAILSGSGIETILRLYLLIVITALFVSMGGLWFSMLDQRSGPTGFVVLLLLLTSSSVAFSQSPFPGIAALSPIPAFLELLPDIRQSGELPRLFGASVSYLVMTIVLYVLFGFWLLLMLVRNFKKEPSEIRLLNRWQAIGFATFLNVLFYALLVPTSTLVSSGMATVAMCLNAGVLLAVGLVTLSPRDKLKMWWRNKARGEESYLSECGLSWPWMVATAVIGFGLFVIASGFIRVIPEPDQQIRQAAVELAVFLTFSIRDVLFLQLCSLTRLKRPIWSGFMYLSLYYVAASIIMAAFEGSRYFLAAVLTPYAVLAPVSDWSNAGMFAGVFIHTVVAVLLLRMIHTRLNRLAIQH